MMKEKSRSPPKWSNGRLPLILACLPTICKNTDSQGCESIDFTLIPRHNQFDPNGIVIRTKYNTVSKARTDYMFCAGFFHTRKKFFKFFLILVTLSPTFNAVYMKRGRHLFSTSERR